ncbi:MAG TPA: carboxypeptidase-like regulatory domain-containing protein [Inquilinus sp.]|nr:carboxypeptidase-like regulatory domain-containing protein [Inquilinus sp.]
MRLSFILGGVAAVMLLAACNHAAPEASPSVPGAAATATGTVPPAPGTGTIRGRGFVRMPNGEMVTCARLKVEAEGPGGSKEATCNSEGYFTIPDVQPGSWHVVSNIFWRIKDKNQIQGVSLDEHVKVEAGALTPMLALGVSFCCRDAAAASEFWRIMTFDATTGKPIRGY